MIKNIISHPALTIAARLVLGVIFIYAGWEKILDPGGFADAVQNYRFLPLETVNIFAIIVPWFEVVCGFLLIVGLFTAGSSLVIALLLLSFLIGLGAALARGLDIGCGCFSSKSADPITYWYLIRDFGLLLLAAQILFCNQRALSLDKVLRKKQH
jgi:uncharacterized membrane protein YphA (DoxX/SURF4 family)